MSPLNLSSPKNIPNATDPDFIQGDRKVMHKKILRSSQMDPHYNGGILEIYRREILPQKTRTVRLLGIKCPAELTQTLLGYEVQARHKRIHCPDLVTARYLKLFSEMGCHSIRLPYDPTLTARLIPVLESAFQNITDTVRGLFPDNSDFQRYVVRKIYAILREQLRNAA